MTIYLGSYIFSDLLTSVQSDININYDNVHATIVLLGSTLESTIRGTRLLPVILSHRAVTPFCYVEEKSRRGSCLWRITGVNLDKQCM